MSDEMIKLRPAISQDAQLLWEWTNDHAVREASFTPDPIPWETHLKWLTEKLNDPDCIFLIAEDDNRQPLGTIRFDLTYPAAVVSVSIDRKARKSGFGSCLISCGSSCLFDIRPDIETVYAYIKLENQGSIKAFAKAGYELAEKLIIKGHSACRYDLRRDFYDE